VIASSAHQSEQQIDEFAKVTAPIMTVGNHSFDENRQQMPLSQSTRRFDRDSGGGCMPIYSIWESRFPAAKADEGRAVTEAIWRDMRGFEGYLGHELLVDADDPGHLFVVSRWASREHADETLRQYRTHPNVTAADSMVSEPRRRFIAKRAGG
jgi:quinol monooxygenase YgiN